MAYSGLWIRNGVKYTIKHYKNSETERVTIFENKEEVISLDNEDDIDSEEIISELEDLEIEETDLEIDTLALDEDLEESAHSFKMAWSTVSDNLEPPKNENNFKPEDFEVDIETEINLGEDELDDFSQSVFDLQTDFTINKEESIKTDNGVIVYDYIMYKDKKDVVKKEFGNRLLAKEMSDLYLKSMMLRLIDEQSGFSMNNGIAAKTITGFDSEGNKYLRVYKITGEVDAVKVNYSNGETYSWYTTLSMSKKYLRKLYDINYKDYTTTFSSADKRKAQYTKSHLSATSIPPIQSLMNRPDLNMNYVYDCDIDVIDTEAKLASFYDTLKDTNDYVFYDAETSGLSFYESLPDELRDKLVTHSFTWKKDQAVIIPVRMRYEKNLPFELIMEAVKPILENKDIVAHNGRADVLFNIPDGIKVNLVEDTMIMFRHLLPYVIKGSKHSMALDYVYKKLFGRDLLDLGGMLFDPLGIKFDFSVLDYDYMKFYGCPDTIALYDIFHALRPKFETYQIKAYKAHVEFSKFVAEKSDWKGIGVDIDAIGREKELALKSVQKLKDTLYEITGETEVTFPLNSRGITNFIYGNLGIPIMKRTKTGAPSADKGIQAELMNEDLLVPSNRFEEDIVDDEGNVLLESATLNKKKYPEIFLIRKYQEEFKNITGYYNGIEKRTINGRFYPDWKLGGADTMRTLGGIQTTKGSLKYYFGVYDKDKQLFMALDYAAEEVKLAANITPDENFKTMLQDPEGDPHIAVATEITGLPPYKVDKELRSAYKACNFGKIYGIQYFSLTKNMYRVENPTKEQLEKGKHASEQYDKTRHIMLKELDKKSSAIKYKGYLVNSIGFRVIYEPLIDSELFERELFDPNIKRPPTVNFSAKRANEYTKNKNGKLVKWIDMLSNVAKNFPVQSLAAYILMAKTNKFARLTKERNMYDYFAMPLYIHDEVDLIIDKEQYHSDLWITTLKEAYEDTMKNLGGENAAPLFVGIGVSDTWGKAKSDSNEIPVGLQVEIAENVKNNIYPEMPEDVTPEQFYKLRIQDYMNRRMRQLFPEFFETKIIDMSIIREKLNHNMFIGKKIQDTFPYKKNPDLSKEENAKLAKEFSNVGIYVESLLWHLPEEERKQYTTVMGDTSKEEESENKPGNLVKEFYLNPLDHHRFIVTEEVLFFNIEGLRRPAIKDILVFLKYYSVPEDSSYKLEVKMKQYTTVIPTNFYLKGLPFNADKIINNIIEGKIKDLSAKDFNDLNRLISPDHKNIIIIKDKLLCIDCSEVSESGVKEILAVLNTTKLSKENNGGYKILLKTATKTYDTNTYIIGMPDELNIKLNEIAIKEKVVMV